MKTDKEKLSEYVEEIFKRYTSSGLHICDIATAHPINQGENSLIL